MNRQLSVLVLGLSFMSLLFSCSTSGSKKSSDKESHKEIEYKYASMKDGLLHLDLNEARKHERKLKLSEICDSLIYIPLETREDALIGRYIEKIMMDGEDIFIHTDMKLLHFNTRGESLGQIGTTGRGPGEYVCGNFFLDENARKIYVRDIYKHYFMTFDYSGKLLDHTFKFEEYPGSVYFVRKDSSVLSSYCYSFFDNKKDEKKSEYTLLKETDIEGNIHNVIKSKYFPKEFEMQPSDFSISYNAISSFMYKDKMNVQEISNDTVFEYSDKALQPRFVLNNRDYKDKVVFKSFEKYLMKAWLTRRNGESPSIKDRAFEYNTVYAESDRYLFIGRGERFVYDKKAGELICYDAIKLKEELNIVNDFDNCLDVRPYRILNNSFILFYPSALDLLEMYEKLENPSSSIYGKRLKSIVDNLKEESNPVIVLARLKK
ncbi:MAG: 6-bladed beta-propeller [Marinifilaceae bacterium]